MTQHFFKKNYQSDLKFYDEHMNHQCFVFLVLGNINFQINLQQIANESTQSL